MLARWLLKLGLLIGGFYTVYLVGLNHGHDVGYNSRQADYFLANKDTVICHYTKNKCNANKSTCKVK